MTTFVLVPGACHGGWCYDDLADTLRSTGHTALAVTLQAVGGGAGDPATTRLRDHVDDVARVLDELPDTEPVVLVGHSYGGMVITGAADARPARVDALVYLDAFVPVDGDAAATLTTDEQRAWYATGEEAGAVPPLPFFDRRATAQPLRTLRDPIHLDGDLARFRRRVYVYATEWAGQPSPLAATYERVRADPSWTVYAPAGAGHNLMRDAPDTLVAALLDAAS